MKTIGFDHLMYILPFDHRGPFLATREAGPC